MPSMTRTSPLRRSLGKTLTVLAGATLLFGLAACAPTPAPDELKTDGDYETAMLDWRQNMDDCMLDAGFDLVAMSENDGSSASIDMSQIDMVAFDKAYAGCSDTVGEAPIDASLPTAEETFEAQLIFAKCMREAGYDYPDPVKGSGMTGAFGSEINPDDVDTCTQLAYDLPSNK